MKTLRISAWIIFLSLPAFAEEWQLITDSRSVRDIAFIGSNLWIGSEGGLTEFIPSSGSFQNFTTLDGLGGISIQRLERDNLGGIWIAFDNRMLQRWDPEKGVTHSISTVSQQDGLQNINDMTIDRRGLYVSTNRGIAVMTYSARYDQWNWYEEYRKLGDFDSDIPVYMVLIEEDTIWAATSQGIARGLLTATPPIIWNNFGPSDGLPAPVVNDLIRVGGVLYAITENGTAKQNGNRWQQLHWRTDIYRLMGFNDSLYAVTSDGISIWNGRAWERKGGRELGASTAEMDSDGSYWIGLTASARSMGGIAMMTDSLWTHYLPEGPTTNNIKAAHFTADGRAYFGGGKTTGEYGVSLFDDGNWTRWTMPENLGSPFSFQNKSIAEDLKGGIWVGTNGGGIIRYQRDGNYSIYNAEDSTGSRLVGYQQQPKMPLTGALDVDGAGNIWVVNRGALDGNILVCVPYEFIDDPRPDISWNYFHRSNFRNFEDFDLLTIDGLGRKWIASSANNPSISGDQGVYVLDDRGTISDSTDDRVWGPLPGLLSAEVLSLKYDPAGYVWVGSPRGAFYVNATSAEITGANFTQVYYMREIPIYAIDIDPAGNKWFGTEFGVYILSPDLFTVTRHITTDPPDRLPSSRVNMVAVDPYSGWAYFGTPQGTARIRTSYRDYGEEIDKVTFEPNPFNPDQSRLIFTGNALAGGAGASIYTPDGRLIRKLSHDEAALGWDGRDDIGQGVADGIYLILTYNGAGQSGQGKVAVIRR